MSSDSSPRYAKYVGRTEEEGESITFKKNILSFSLKKTPAEACVLAVFNVVNSAGKMSTYLGIMSTMSGRLSTNSENDCQPHLEKSRKLSTEIRKNILSFFS